MTELRSGSASDVGRVRPVNQDLALERPHLYAVADGMGGHVGGEVAARVAVETLEHAFARAPTAAGLFGAFSEANLAVWQESQSNTELRGMGTTLTALALVGDSDGHGVLALANVGDSRAYVLSENQMVQVTDDHSLAEERMRLGEMSEEEAAVHPQRHILTRALGVGSQVDTDMWELRLRSGDRVLLCSDGLSNELSPEEMAEILADVRDPEAAAKRLVQVANEHGGSDNITVVVVDVQKADDTGATSSVVTPLGLEFPASADGATREASDAPARRDPPARGDPDESPAGSESAGTSSGVVPDHGEGQHRGDDAPPGAPGQGGPAAPGSRATAVVGAPTAAVPAMGDRLAPGSHLGFADHSSGLADTGPRSDEFFLGTVPPVPVARASTEMAPVPTTPSEKRPSQKETRRERRRRLGIPRRITVRVVLFVLLVAAVPVATYFVIRWYAYDNWIVTLQRDNVVIKQGQPGGVLWFSPRVVDRTGLTASQMPPVGLRAIRSGVQEPSLQKAKAYVFGLYMQTASTSTTTTTTTTTTTAPNGSTTTTTAPAPAAAPAPGAVPAPGAAP